MSPTEITDHNVHDVPAPPVPREEGRAARGMFIHEATDVETLRRHMAESDLPNLWKPGRDCYMEVESLPIIGSGKLALKGIKEIAAAAMGK